MNSNLIYSGKFLSITNNLKKIRQINYKHGHDNNETQNTFSTIFRKYKCKIFEERIHIIWCQFLDEL